MPQLNRVNIKHSGNFIRQSSKVSRQTSILFSSSSPYLIGFTFLASKPGLFNPATVNCQFPPKSVFRPQNEDAGGIVLVTDLPSALVALTTIVNQGEGNPRPFDGPQKDEKDHYDIFLDLQTDTQTWDVFPVMTDPTTASYFYLDKKIYAVS